MQINEKPPLLPVGARFSAPLQTGPGAHPASCAVGTGSFPGVKSGRGVTLTPHPLLVPWSRKGGPIPILPLWAVRPVQSLSVCIRVHFTFTFFLPYLNVVCPVQFLPTVLGCQCDLAFKSPRETQCSASCVSASSANTPGLSRADSGNAHKAVRC